MGKFIDEMRARASADPTHHPVAPMPKISNDVIDFETPGMFASADKKVISWEGEHYFKTCGVVVTEDDNQKTTCLKREGHPNDHEDFDGHILREEPRKFDFTNMPLEQAVYEAMAAASVCWEDMSGTGIFDSLQAKEIADALLFRIKYGKRL